MMGGEVVDTKRYTGCWTGRSAKWSIRWGSWVGKLGERRCKRNKTLDGATERDWDEGLDRVSVGALK